MSSTIKLLLLATLIAGCASHQRFENYSHSAMGYTQWVNSHNQKLQGETPQWNPFE